MEQINEIWWDSLTSAEQKAFIRAKQFKSVAEVREKGRVRQARYRAKKRALAKIVKPKLGRPPLNRTDSEKRLMRRHYMRQYRASKKLMVAI